jgi:penicillin G amidase
MQRAKRFIQAPSLVILLLVLALGVVAAGIVWLAYTFLNTALFWIVIGLVALLLILFVIKNRMTILLLGIAAPKLRASAPKLEQNVTLKGLDAPVTIDFDQFGVPTIKAKSRLDAMRGLGYVSARDRLFQMDLLRRAAGGRLTEIFGKAVLKMDTNQRIIGCNRVAPKVVSKLPADQREVLEAYSEGVNAFISQPQSRPFECRLLKYQPEQWNSESSVLTLLQMFQNLTAEEEPKRRTLAIIEKTLPKEVMEFLTPEDGPYLTLLGWGSHSHQPVTPLPVAELAKLMREEKAEPEKKIVKTEGMTTSASNCWAVDKSKTANGRAILSNDMHTGLSVPNLWYRVRLCYDDVDLCGVIIPGIPMVLAGSNKRIAWGLTNMLGGCLDLAPIEIDPEQPDHYLTPEGPRPFELIKEPIKRKIGDFVDTAVKTTIWGPVLEKPLMGQPVAMRWTAHDPESVDFGLMHMEKARTVEEAVPVINRFYGPPLNVLVADERGRIAYTMCGKFPARSNGAMNFATAGKAWSEYIPADELPRLVESQNGFLVNANNLSVGSEYPYLLGNGFPQSYRAYRIAERLRDMSNVTEAEMFDLQADTVCEIYEFYKHLALDALTEQDVAGDPELKIVLHAIQTWDGKAEVDSLGLVFLTYFRESLAQSVFTPILRRCAEADENFVYAWPNLDTPLRMILKEQPVDLLPGRYATWEQFIAGMLKDGIRQLKEERKLRSLENLNWGKLNKAEIFHPLAQQDRSFAGRLFNMPEDPLPGCVFSVCSSEPGYGASIRLVVTPGQESAGVLHITCGQSGHPLSPHYDDQNEYWVRHERLPFLPGPSTHTLTLSP